MTPEHSKMSANIDHPFLCGHACKLTSIAGVLFQVHHEICIKAVKWRQVLDGMNKLRLSSVTMSVSQGR